MWAVAVIAVVASLAALPTWAQVQSQAQPQPVEVSSAWVRVAVTGQQGTGAFLKITATAPVKLVGASSPLAGVAEVHQMKLVGDVMTMRAVPSLAIAAGESVEFKPGGYHIMLMDLKQAMPAGSQVPLTLHFKDGKGKEMKVFLKLPVAAVAPTSAKR